jgi:wobble nucleotide-excising tRNase
MNFGGHVSVRTVTRRLNEQFLRARRPTKRSQLSLQHRGGGMSMELII